MLQSFTKKFGILNNAVFKAVEFLNKKEIIKNFTDVIIQILNADYGFVFFKETGSTKFQLLYSDPRTPFQPPPPRKKGVTQKAFSKKAPIYLPDYPESSWLIKSLGPHIKSFVSIPICYQNFKYGTFNICFKDRHEFTTEEQLLCELAGNSAAHAITIHSLNFSLKDFKNRLDRTLDSVFIFHPLTFQIEYANVGATKQLGFSHSELLQKTILDIQPKMDKAQFNRLVTPLIFQKRDSLTVESVLKAKNGRNVPVELFLQLSRSLEGSRKFLSIVHDITERKRVEEESKKLLKQKDEFLSIASHELKTPVTTIKGFTQILSDKLKFSDEQTRYFLSKINGQVDKLNHLIKDLLDVSRIETGKMKFQNSRFELSEVVSSDVENLKIAFPSHNIVFKPSDKFWVKADQERIEQVLTNLISNAAKYSPPKSKIIVSLQKQGKAVNVKVEDFGIGIPEKDRERIFKRFFQSKRSTHEAYPGMGLGLYISHTIIEHHKGGISYSPKKSKGSIFNFSLPYQKWLRT